MIPNFTLSISYVLWRLWAEIEAHKWRDLELNLSKTVGRIAPGLSAYSSQQHEKAERQQKTSRVQFCSNLVPNHANYAPRSLPTVCIFINQKFWKIAFC